MKDIDIAVDIYEITANGESVFLTRDAIRARYCKSRAGNITQTGRNQSFLFQEPSKREAGYDLLFLLPIPFMHRKIFATEVSLLTKLPKMHIQRELKFTMT